MNWKRGLGICLLFVGVFLVFTARVLTGAVVGLQKENLIGLVGLIVFIVGILLILDLGKLLGKEFKYKPPKQSQDYYRRRVNELTKYRGDAWVSQWELNGILNELDKKGYDFEHKEDMPYVHIGGHGPRVQHFNIERKSKLSDTRSYNDKHILITADPYDPRLRIVGVKEVSGKIKRIYSKVYHPMHPRKSVGEKRDYSKKIGVT